ncbi:MAG TPA: response regulator transcription factor, partial [Isosphaeraceae bacterium]|nr:response regulator transcription factor [Isosphaeraceae bacterium]
MTAKTILIVDDHAVVRAGIRALLNDVPDLTVIGEAATAREALDLTRLLRPDFVLLDITLPDGSGLDLIPSLVTTAPGVRIIVLTMHEGEEYFFQALRAGAAGYVVKSGDAEHILAALRAVLEGGVYLYPTLARTLVGRHLREQGDRAPPDLSPREQEVLRLIAEGLSNKEIAARLSISVTTAQTHRNRIMEKLGLHTAVELVRYAIRAGLIRP